MELSELMQKQKRLKTWGQFQDQIEDDALRIKIADTLKMYRNSLAKCWEHQEITEADVRHLQDIERQLESFNEQVRMATFHQNGAQSDAKRK